MLFRTISTACLMLCLSAIGTACDDKKPEAKADAKGKADEKKATDAKATDAKATDAKADEAKAAEAKAAEAKAAEDAKAAQDAKAAEDAKAADAKAEDAKAADAKAPETKVEEKKAVEKPADPKKPATEAPKPDPGPSADGKGLYDKKCKNCHNGNGDGKTKIGGENDIEDWTVAGWKAKWTQQKIEDIVLNGKSGSKMKPFKDKLTADEIAAVSKYARSLGK